MPIEKLTANRVETARAQDSKRLEIRDAKVSGLELRVTVKGIKSWYFNYTRRADGKRRRILLGTYPAMSLKDARREVIRLRGKVENRQDPAGEKRATKTATTFRELAELRLKLDNGIGAATKEQYRQAFNADVFKAIGHLPANEVTADMVARILDDVEGRGAAVHADRVKSAIGSTFKWAVKRRRADVLSDPTAGLGKRAPSVARMRVLDDTELTNFWHGVSAPGSPLTKSMQLIIKLAILTDQRRAEVCGTHTSELKMSSQNPTWIIPGDKRQAGQVIAGRMKNRLDQVVPLSRQAKHLWQEAIALAEQSEFVFPSRAAQTNSARQSRFPHIRPDSVSQATRRLRAMVGVDDVHLHDMRRCIATWCGDHGVRPDVIDRILSHKPRDVTRRHYNFAGMDHLVLEALQAWSDHVWAITDQRDPAEA
jgi:integrase